MKLYALGTTEHLKEKYGMKWTGESLR